MPKDEHEEDFDEVYDENGRDDLVKNDEMSPEEEAFMQGYEQVTEEEEKPEDETEEKEEKED